MALSKNILVTGATGKQGGAVARALLRQGQRVRTLTRKPEAAMDLARLGVRVFRGDFNDRASVAAAMRGCDGVFAVSTPFEAGMDAEVRQGMTLAAAAKEEGIRHYVYTSVASAERGTGIPHFETKAEVEVYVKRLGLPYTILRPVWFMENFGTWLLPGIQAGTLSAPMRPQTRLHMVALQDIGEFAAAAFIQRERFLGREIGLAGDVLTFPQVAEQLSGALGRTVEFKQIPEDQAERSVGRDMALMYKWFNEKGYDIDIPALARSYGLRLTKFPEFLAGAAWAKPPLIGRSS